VCKVVVKECVLFRWSREEGDYINGRRSRDLSKPFSCEPKPPFDTPPQEPWMDPVSNRMKMKLYTWLKRLKRDVEFSDV
jgi:hypothetical protein